MSKRNNTIDIHFRNQVKLYSFPNRPHNITMLVTYRGTTYNTKKGKEKLVKMMCYVTYKGKVVNSGDVMGY